MVKTGYAFIRESEGGRVELMSVGTISTDSKSTLSKRIQVISKTMAMLIKETRPDLAVVERVIVNINPKTSLALGEARGAILSTLTMQNIDIVELTPMQVKLGVTGKGRATKVQVATMVRQILKIPKNDILTNDETDAIACALSQREPKFKIVGNTAYHTIRFRRGKRRV